MTGISDEMIKALEKSRKKLSNEAVNMIREFLKTCYHKEGGFTDRAGNADPYYSVFGYSLAYVFDVEVNTDMQKKAVKRWKESQKIDLVHAVSIIQCAVLIEVLELKQKSKALTGLFSGLEPAVSFVRSKVARKVKKVHSDLFEIIEEYRSVDGSYNQLKKNMPVGNIYATFLVWSLYEDMGIAGKNDNIFRCLSGLKLEDGSYVNDISSKSGVTSAASAGIIMQLAQGNKHVRSSVDWLKRMYNRQGGFTIGENLPMADILSTATALFAMSMAKEPMESYATKTTEFINLHWDKSGGFFGSIADMKPDCEYTFYALLTLGLIN